MFTFDSYGTTGYNQLNGKWFNIKSMKYTGNWHEDIG